MGVDFNHDTIIDIAETNGDSSASGTFANERSYLWMQQANGQYLEQSAVSGLNHLMRGRGMINLDIDNDGDQDLVIWANDQNCTLWRNDLASGADTNWLRVFLDTSNEPHLAPNGYGSEVWVTVGSDSWMRNIDGGDNFLSMSELSAHFGLGTATTVDELKVVWADGTETVLTNLATNQDVTVVADSPWNDLGNGLAGTPAGKPRLTGHGTLEPLSDVILTLTGAQPNTTFSLILGVGQLNATFKQGVMVPTVDVIISGLPTLTYGMISIPFVWPAGISGSSLYWQYWISDAGGSVGFSATNGLETVSQ